MSFYTIGTSNKKMNFREYLFMFINEPNKIGELVRSIYYGTSRHLVGEFQSKVQDIITEVDKSEDNEILSRTQKFMKDPENMQNQNPNMIWKQQQFFDTLVRIYSSYRTLKTVADTNSNEDIFATQYKINEIPITQKDKTMTKIISPPTSHECINCSSKMYTRIFRQIVTLDFLNDIIKYATYYECDNCNKIVLQGL